MKKIVTKKLDKIDPDFKRYLGALNEMHGQTLKAIKENSVITNSKIDNLTKKVDQHTEMIGVIMEDVAVLKEDVSVLKEDVAVLKEDVSELKTDMKIVKEDISTMKGELKKKVDYDEFISLVQRVQKLESKR